jgi:hypothetical protein
VRNPQTSQSFLKIQAYHLIVIQSLVFFGLSHPLLDWESTFFSERQVPQINTHLRQMQEREDWFWVRVNRFLVGYVAGSAAGG